MTQSLILGGFHFGVVCLFGCLVVWCVLFFVLKVNVGTGTFPLAGLAASDLSFPLNVRLLEEGDTSKEILDGILNL